MTMLWSVVSSLG